MKKLVLIISLIIGATFIMSFTTVKIEKIKTETILNSDYEDGWEEGYCEGWKDVKGQNSVCPVTPVCPVPNVDCYEGYKCGYNRGFKAGMKEARAK